VWFVIGPRNWPPSGRSRGCCGGERSRSPILPALCPRCGERRYGSAARPCSSKGTPTVRSVPRSRTTGTRFGPVPLGRRFRRRSVGRRGRREVRAGVEPSSLVAPPVQGELISGTICRRVEGVRRAGSSTGPGFPRGRPVGSCRRLPGSGDEVPIRAGRQTLSAVRAHLLWSHAILCWR